MKRDRTLPSLMPEERRALRRSLAAENAGRARVFAKIVIGIELLFLVLDAAASFTPYHDTFRFRFYIYLYLSMIAMNAALLKLSSRFERLASPSDRDVARFEAFLMAFVIAFMAWGIVVVLADQSLYGQVMAFALNIIGASVIFYFPARRLAFAYAVSTVGLFALLPLFQPSVNVLIGHYINLTAFLTFSWIASRLLYATYVREFYSRLRLQAESEEKDSVRRQLELANRELERLTLVDELSGIPNRRALYRFVDFALGRQSSGDRAVSALMLDIDHFKPYNDQYGHAAGDEAICAIAEALQASVRHSFDFAARIGGEEFVFVAFDSSEDDIAAVAESIRARVLELRIPHAYGGVDGLVTVSLGAATGELRRPEDFAQLLRRADQALYEAKAEGRNRTASSAPL